MNFIDTNILLYSVSADPQERSKRDVARSLLESDDCALSVQVLQEFYVQATRPTRDDRLSHELAVGLIETWMRFPIQDITLSVFAGALKIKEKHRLSYWDSAIVAAAQALGCERLYSEDFSHKSKFESVTVVDPFRR
ncbi:MAG TPA: PIN domain-containing protein [Candidatus Baltobacteraceae bacterium]|nr:PIN domain-containing protein [Candidatus Baltobacteraceae bacterium]